MAKQLQLTISTPCHENWDAMTPVDKGKFCGSCQKQVVDFTGMSDRQVAEFFKKPSTGSVCGRFMTDQLDRSIEIPKKRIPWVKYFFQIALPAFLVSARASAQKKVVVSHLSVKRPAPLVTMGLFGIPTEQETTPIKNITKAKIINEAGEPVPYASIETEKSHIKLMADSNGVFELNKKLLLKYENIVVSSAGFENSTLSTGSSPFFMRDEIIINMISKAILPEIVLTSYYGTVRKGGVTGAVSICRSSSLSEKIDSITKVVIKPLTSINKLKIYPNPVLSGSTINISISELEENYYSLQLLNISSQLIHKSEIWISRDARQLNYNLPAVADGSYFIILTNKKTGIKFSEKIIVQ